MASKIICNITSRERRVALIENGVIAELFMEITFDQNIVGNIYKGTVTKVLPGMQVAFVDIGLTKAGFLYVSDIDLATNHFTSELTNREMDDLSNTRYLEMDNDESRPRDTRIEDMLTEGQEIMVQVSKDPLGAKGARITSYITMPGRYLVYMPTVSQIGVSRRIGSDEEKKRLKDLLKSMKSNGSGYIIRTAAEGKSGADLKNDIEYLDKLWGSISDNYVETSNPGLVYKDLGLIQKCIRDLYTHDIEAVVVDDTKEYEKMVSFCQSYLPEVVDKLEFYDNQVPVFDAYGLEIEIGRALERKVWLKSGGSIVIDQTEALTAIDVNTGKFVGKHNLEETILKTNMEALKEIVYQLRLRNIGGLIIIDFIDMEPEENKEKVYGALERALQNDRARVNILKISELGLVEMTRKRVRESLSRTMSTTCPYCEGRGMVKSSSTMLFELYREIGRVANKTSSPKKIVCVVSTDVADLLFHEESAYIDQLEHQLDADIVLDSDDSFHQEKFVVTAQEASGIF